jgi:hypothetical protein
MRLTGTTIYLLGELFEEGPTIVETKPEEQS